MQQNNPRGYMQLIKSMRDGNFDKQTTDDTSGVSPTDWYTHFSNLLAKQVDFNKTKTLKDLFLKMLTSSKLNLMIHFLWKNLILY